MKKILALGCVLVLTLSLLTGCSKKGGSTAQTGGKTVEFWLFNDWVEGDAGAEFNAYTREFREQTGITVNLVGKPDSEIKSGLIVGASSGMGPDGFTLALNTAYSMINSGAVQDITQYWNAETADYKSQFTPAIMNSMQVDGKVWGLPMTGWSTVLYRNLDALQKAGVDTSRGPADWDEWLDQMRRVRAAGSNGMNDFTVDGWAVYNFLGGVRGIKNTVVNGKSSYTHDQLATCFDFMNKVAQYGTKIPRDDAAADDMFITGQVAFVTHGPWPNTNYAAAAAEGKLRYDVVQIPSQEKGRNGGLHGGEWLGISTGKNAENAYKWISFVGDAKQMSRFASKMGRLIFNDRAMAQANISGNALLSAQVEALKGGIDDAAYFTPFPSDVKPVSDAANAVVYGRATPAQAADTCLADIAKLIDDNT